MFELVAHVPLRENTPGPSPTEANGAGSPSYWPVGTKVLSSTFGRGDDMDEEDITHDSVDTYAFSGSSFFEVCSCTNNQAQVHADTKKISTKKTGSRKEEDLFKEGF